MSTHSRVNYSGRNRNENENEFQKPFLSPVTSNVSLCYICATTLIRCRDDSRFAPSQWETFLQSNAISHWLGANLESALRCFSINKLNMYPLSSYLWCEHSSLVPLPAIQAIPPIIIAPFYMSTIPVIGRHMAQGTMTAVRRIHSPRHFTLTGYILCSHASLLIGTATDTWLSLMVAQDISMG